MPELVLMRFDYVAFFAMGVVFFGLIYFVIWLGDLPATIARKRNHPQVPAVQALAWMGLLFTGGVVYILAFAWAYYNYPQTVHGIPEEPESKSEADGKANATNQGLHASAAAGGQS